MFTRSLAGFAVFLVAVCCVEARADEPGTEIDLTEFGQIPTDTAPEWRDIPLLDVAQRLGTAPRRFYGSLMIGPSFANFGSPTVSFLDSSQTIFNAGGALGVAFERTRGQLRWEVEGMGRGTYDAPFDSDPTTNTVLTNNWSVMTNLWRDFMFSKSFGVYGGGGIGAGGYILGERIADTTDYIVPGSNFAWQAGGGVLWNISDRLTFDVGYRYYQINTIQQTGSIVPNQFQSSEVMFSLRLFEPFRGFTR